VRAFPRIRDEAQYWQQVAKQNARRVAELEADREFQMFRDRTDVAWLEGKVVAQARELKRLNDHRNVERIKRGVDPIDDVQVSSITPVEVVSQFREAGQG